MLDGLTLDQIRLFVTVAESGSFRAAAARVARAQSAVSMAVANLEEQLGVTLFDRSGYRPSLTPEGHALLEDAQAVLLKIDLMRARAKGLDAGVELKLGMAVDPLFPPASIGHALKDLQTAFPTVAIRLWTAPLGGTFAALKEGRATFAICFQKALERRLEFEDMGSISLVAVAAAQHPLGLLAAAGRRISAPELADHIQIVLSDPTPMTEGRDFGVRSPGTWRVSDIYSKHALILAGTGWGNLPLWMVADDLEAGRLVRVPSVDLGPSAETAFRAYLAHPIDSPLGPAARFLRDRLLTCMGQLTAPAPPQARRL